MAMKPKRLLALIALLTIVAACSQEAPETATELRDSLIIAFDSSPTHLDARVGNDQNTGRVFDLIYAGLVRVTTSGDHEPDLAESWTMPDDTTIVFKLREGLVFHDGTPLTASDVVFSFQSLIAEDFPGPKKSGYTDVASIEATDDLTVVFRLTVANAGIFDTLNLGIVPEGSAHEVLRTEPIGAGPYRLVEFRPDEKVVLESFDRFHGGEPSIRNIMIRVVPDSTTRVLELRRGSIDFALNNVPFDSVLKFQNDPRMRVVAEPGAIYQYVAFNLRNEYLAKLAVREAIAHAIDRERIVRDLMLGFGAVTETLFPPGHWAHNKDLTSWNYEPNLARQLLDDAGYPDPDGNGPATRFNLTFKTSTDEETNLQAEIIQQMLAEVGIGIRIQSNEFGVFYDDITKGNFELFSLRRAGVNDPDFYTFMFDSSNTPPNGQNRGYYSNARVDELLAEGRVTFDREKRIEIYGEVQTILANELPYLSLYHRSNIAIMNSDIEGFRMHPAGFLLTLPAVRWRE